MSASTKEVFWLIVNDDASDDANDDASDYVGVNDDASDYVGASDDANDKWWMVSMT